MNKYTQIKKTISFILIVTFLSTNSAYSLPMKDTLRPPLQTAPGNVAEQRRILNKDESMGFTERQKEEIQEEIQKYCSLKIQEAKESLQKIYELNLITLQNQEALFTILKEIPRNVGTYASEAYHSIIYLLKSGLITQSNQEQVFAILKEIPKYAKYFTPDAYHDLIELLKSGLINQANQERIFAILKEIPQYAGLDTSSAYKSLISLLKSDVITEANQEQIFDILKEIPQYAGVSTSQAYYSIISMLNAHWQTEDMVGSLKMIMRGTIHLKYGYKIIDMVLKASPVGTVYTLEAEPTIKQLAFSTIPIDFEVAIYPVDGKWMIARGDDKSVNIENWKTLRGYNILLAHNHPRSLTLPSPEDLMLFSKSGIGLIISGIGNRYTLTLFKTPRINPETGHEFISDEEMYGLFKRKIDDLNTSPLSSLTEALERYIKDTGVELVVMDNLAEEDEGLTITTFVEKYKHLIKPMEEDSENPFKSSVEDILNSTKTHRSDI